MNRNLLRSVLLVLMLCTTIVAQAWDGMAMPRLHVEGRYFKDEQGNIVNLHGFAQTYSPYFNELGTKWDNYDVSGCLSYNKGLIDKISAAGWKMSFLRLHMDPYWSNKPGATVTGENDISAFDMTRFKKYFHSVFLPMAKYAISKGLYVVMRPPGVCPEKIAVGDDYQQYLLQVWDYVSQQTDVMNNPNIMFELANEPVSIVDASGNTAGDKDMTEYFQAIVDKIRENCSNIVLVPGLGWQSNYAGFANYPIRGENVGYAVHCYPGWMNSGAEDTPTVEYSSFKAGWDRQVKPVADFAPIVVTEMDWVPASYELSWGKGVTGEAGGTGFGANFKKIADEYGNVSWLIFTGAHLLAQFKDQAPTNGKYTFLTDPEACPWPAYHWYEEYSKTQYPRSSFLASYTADNGNGTFTNPLIKADYPDPDVIFVDGTYYMVSTTMHHFPGCTLLKSKDLVNWEYCANPLTRMSTNSEYNLEDAKNIYGKGDWANSLFYKNGRFYIMFNAFGSGDDAGGYLLSASDPEGQWTMTRLDRGYYDPGVLVDDDGTVYVVYGNNSLSVAKLDDNFRFVSAQEVVTNGGVEGSHFVKKDGYYYIYCVNPAWPGTQWCWRSTSPMSGYGSGRKLFDQDAIHQGQLIQTQTGEWWTILMQDQGAIGRIPWLQPVTWVDGWPVIGDNGKAVTTLTKPNVGTVSAPKALPTNDTFRDYQIGMQWQWNHNPDNTAWSLFENPGYLRLYTSGTADSLTQARNTLTQRIFGRKNNYPSLGTVAMDVTNMKEGDMAGLTVFQDPYAYIAVNRTATGYQLVQYNQKTDTKRTVAITPNGLVYLRAQVNFQTSKATFYYSLDNTTYTKLGTELEMAYNLSVFVGNRFGIFNYATEQEGGYVDVDWFTTEPNSFTESDYYDDSVTGYTEESVTATSLTASATNVDMLLGSSQTVTLTATFKDGHTEDVTTEATYSVDFDNRVTATNGRLQAIGTGEANVTATYKDKLGNEQSVRFVVNVEMFPLKNGLLNPSIWTDGTFNEQTGALTTGQYGFGGWQYSDGLDLSQYKYLVVQLKRSQTVGAQLRLYDENNYWTNCAQSEFGNNRTIRVDLTSAKVVDDGTKSAVRALDPSHIYIIGFWTYGGSPFYISRVFVSNDGTTPVDTGIDGVAAEEETPLADVYNFSGQLVIKNADTRYLNDDLPAGIYVVKGKKVIVK